MPAAFGRFLETYARLPVLIVLLLGIASGLPLALTYSTLSVWLTEAGVSRTQIALFALAGTPYIWKFAWAPIMDAVPPPLFAELGRRRGWMVLTQIGLIFAILAAALTDPAQSPTQIALAALGIAFFSASQDIVIDAYRIESLAPQQQGAGSAVTIYGYRLGMLISGAGALYLAEVFSWTIVYAAMAAIIAVAILLVLCIPEPPLPEAAKAPPPRDLKGWVQTTLIAPFRSFILSQPRWLLILLFVVLYKLGDAVAGVMTNPFYLAIGFSKSDIATISKLWGLIATLVGVFIGGWMVGQMGLLKALLVGGILQAASNVIFVWQAYAGADLAVLSVTVFVENATAGIGTAPLVAYLSSLSQRQYSATHYALLSAFAATARSFLASGGGWLSEQMSWAWFFISSALVAVPALLILLMLMRYDRKPESA